MINLDDTQYYFDCNALWKFYEGKNEKGCLNLHRLVANRSYPILLSPLTVTEFFSVLMKKFRQGFLKRRQIRRVIERFRRDVGLVTTNRPFTIVSTPEGSFQLANEILLTYADTFDIGSNDSLHLAIVSKLQESLGNSVIMVTSDHSLQKVSERIDIEWYDPELYGD